MGLFEDFGEALPADKREAFKADVSALDGAVKIDSRETVDKLAIENPFMKSAIDSAISRAVESHDAKFKAEKLPGMIEEEIKRRGPKPKDPELAAALERVEALEKAKKQAEDANIRMAQLSKVLPVVTELGLDAKWADRLIGDTDAETEELVKAFKADVTKARDGYTEKILKERFGNQGMPPRGGSAPTSREDLQQKYNELMQKKQFQQALVVQAEMQRLGEK
jgi:hypothetical protein